MLKISDSSGSIIFTSMPVVRRAFMACVVVSAIVSSSGLVEAGVMNTNVSNGKTLFGFSPFPYDRTIEAVNRTYDVVNSYGSIYVVQRDNGIPWYEAWAGKAYPQQVVKTWTDYLNHKPKLPVYLALAPLGEDRQTLIHASDGSRKPGFVKNLAINDPKVKKAYLNYVRRAVKTFKPEFLNIGLEAGELAYRAPRKWSQFEDLFNYVYRNIKSEFPKVKIGISFGLQSLMVDSVSSRVRGLVNTSDFVGISFYPYMSRFHERFGMRPLPAAPNQWRTPLKWLRNYTRKPIAITETGYSADPVHLHDSNLKLPGNADLQQQYLKDLASIANRDKYIFVVWYMPIDYDKLFQSVKMNNDAYKIWQHVGMFDQNLKPRPAWETWKTIVRKNKNPGWIDHGKQQSGSTFVVPFGDSSPTFVGSGSDKIKVVKNGRNISGKSLRWKFHYKGGRFQWVQQSVAKGSLKGKKYIALKIKSNKKGPVLLQLEEANGESYYTVLQPSPSWKLIRLKLSTFELDKKKKKNGKFEPGKVNKLLLADPGAVTEGAAGKRTIQVAEWRFD